MAGHGTLRTNPGRYNVRTTRGEDITSRLDQTTGATVETLHRTRATSVTSGCLEWLRGAADEDRVG